MLLVSKVSMTICWRKFPKANKNHVLLIELVCCRHMTESCCILIYNYTISAINSTAYQNNVIKLK